MGKTWSSWKTITSNDLERAVIATDLSPGSLFFNRIYTAWVDFTNFFRVYFSYSDNRAESWSTPALVNTAQNCAGGDIFINKNGVVYLTWAGIASQSPFIEKNIGFASSSDGGASWNVKENAFIVNGLQGTLPEKSNIRINGLPKIAVDTSGGPRNGWIYIVTGQKNLEPAGFDPDVILYRSSDGGINWSAGIRVNQDSKNNGKIQFFPAVHVDYNGGLNIIYYDDRNTTSDSTGVFLSRSTDGGDSWNEYPISKHNFKPQTIGGGFQPDNLSITSSGSILLPFWMDNSTGVYQLWTSRIDLNMIRVDDFVSDMPLKFSLDQNYPNPFNSLTTIQYHIPEESFVTIKIYNSNGEEIEEVFRGIKSPASYVLSFNADNYSSGIYFCRITANNYDSAIKMILLK
jgi:hypothetical protein